MKKNGFLKKFSCKVHGEVKDKTKKLYDETENNMKRG
jgi:hypothetical protein